MNEIPWWALSPSPFTLAFWLVLTAYGMKQLLRKVEYKRWRYYHAFGEASSTVGFIVLLLDLCWVVVCALRFGSMFPNSMMQLALAGLRDLVGVIFCYLLIGNYFKTNVLHFKTSTILLVLVNWLFLAVWFIFAPSPAYTDWTFAIKHGYSVGVVALSFLVSHVVGKSLVASIYYALWRKTT